MANATTALKRPLTSTAKIKEVAQKKNVPSDWLFGMHLTLDGYGGDFAQLNDMDLVFTALSELPELLDMHKIITPYVVRAEANNKKDEGGYSGFVMIAESHISIHTFPHRGFVSIDVYTCQGELNVKTCVAYFKRTFGIRRFEQHVIRRGRNYGRS